ncbi:MAG TPA: hypothetical protein VFE47_03395, partial [Tepidisphaeraceae bacterium]|nr:hypothetical protein [Tepidisphaeraceae bacterium]
QSGGLDHLITALARRERLFWLKIAAMLATGPWLCFLGPLAVSALVWGLTTGKHVEYRGSLAWLTLFEWTAAIMIPLMFIREWRARHTLLEEAFLAGELGRNPPNYSPYNPTGGGDGLYLLLEIFLIGPRLIVRAMRLWGERRGIRHIDRNQAAIVLSAIIDAGKGVEIETLRVPGADRLMIRKIVIYLAFYEWIDLSSDLTRTWVETSALRKLGSA